MMLELREDLSASFYRSDRSGIRLDTNGYTNALGLDLYPLSVLVLRLKAALTYRDRLGSGADAWMGSFDLRATAQL
jgi:hypothetical protein